MKTTTKLSKWCKSTLMILFAALMATGCDKTEDTINPFEGADNHITSFVLTKGDVSYTAAVAAGTITVTVPANVSLSGFTVAYQLCENATINPDPATVTNWESEHLFRVTAYNGTKITYRYTVAHSDVVHAGAVVLKTQVEVDAFGQGGYTVIDGYLAIGASSGTDTITSLAPLASLKTTGGIIINTTYGSEGLTAFENLETVGELHVLSKKVKTVRFPNLTAVRLNMNFDAASAIETLDFPELIAIERSLRIYSVNALSTINFPKLQQVLENVTIEGMQSLQSVDFPELTGTGVCTLTNLNSLTQVSAPKLETVAGMSLTGAATLTAVNLPALNTVTGNLSMSAASLTVLQFPTLTTVDGTLTLTTPLLTSLRLPSLRKVGTFAAADLQSLGILDVRGMDIGTLSFAYTTLVRTKGIKLIGDETFNGNLSLVFALAATAPASAPAFPVTVEGIKVVGGLEIVGNPGNSQIPITAIEFDWLERVTGLLYFYNLNKVTRIELPNLQEVGGLKISLTNLETLLLPKLEEITGYTSGTTAAGDFDYTVSNNNITALELSKLKSVVGDISITGLIAARKLATISFPALESITGTLTIAGTSNTMFKNLSGFSILKSAAGVTISNFTQLSDFSPLAKVVCSLPNATAWKITGCGGTPANYSYETMQNTYCNND